MSDDSSPSDIAATVADLAAAHPELEIRARHATTPRQRVVVWIVGSVLAALLPIVIAGVHGLDSSAVSGFYDLLGRGELLLIAITIAIAGVAELSLTLRQVKTNQTLWVALLLLGNLLLVASAALWYGDLTSAEAANHVEQAAVGVTWGSTGVFAGAAVFSSICVWIAAGVDR